MQYHIMKNQQIFIKIFNHQENSLKLFQAIYDLEESHQLVDRQKVLQYQKYVLEMRRKIYKIDHTDLANSINAVGLMYENLDYPKNSLLYPKCFGNEYKII